MQTHANQNALPFPLTPAEAALRERLRARMQSAAQTPAPPAVTIRPVSDDTLRLLGRVDPGRAQGEIDARDQAILAMTLPDICAELLAHRQAAYRRAAREART